jgi:hypothetical protein
MSQVGGVPVRPSGGIGRLPLRSVTPHWLSCVGCFAIALRPVRMANARSTGRCAHGRCAHPHGVVGTPGGAQRRRSRYVSASAPARKAETVDDLAVYVLGADVVAILALINERPGAFAGSRAPCLSLHVLRPTTAAWPSLAGLPGACGGIQMVVVLARVRALRALSSLSGRGCPHAVAARSAESRR